MLFYIVLTLIYATSGLCSTGNTRKYHQIDVYIYQCGFAGGPTVHRYCVLARHIALGSKMYFSFSYVLAINNVFKIYFETVWSILL